jgi:hypothetical protein
MGRRDDLAGGEPERDAADVGEVVARSPAEVRAHEVRERDLALAVHDHVDVGIQAKHALGLQRHVGAAEHGPPVRPELAKRRRELAEVPEVPSEDRAGQDVGRLVDEHLGDHADRLIRAAVVEDPELGGVADPLVLQRVRLQVAEGERHGQLLHVPDPLVHQRDLDF